MRHAILLVIAVMVTSCASVRQANKTECVKPEPVLLPGAQITCPVMEGKRINNRLYVDYQGYRIYVCCNPCVKAVRKDPEKYLKRLLAAGITPQTVTQYAAAGKEIEGVGKQNEKKNETPGTEAQVLQAAEAKTDNR